jgi:hypothetical protein
VKDGRDPSARLPAWWVEAAVLLPTYFVYTATRGVADSSGADAVAFGWDLQRFSEAVHIDVELGLNHWLQGVPALAVICCYYYATLHFIVTPAVLFWTHRRHPRHYVQARWTIVLTTLISLAGFFLFPTAPPRLLAGSGYLDTMARFDGWGWWSSTSSAAPDGLGSLGNQYAALPSLHCAWALWCGFLLVRYARKPAVRVFGALYPAATVFVVMGTANHYLVDAFAGWAVLGAASLTVAVLMRRRARRGPAAPAASAGGGPTPDLERAMPADDAARPAPAVPAMPAGPARRERLPPTGVPSASVPR